MKNKILILILLFLSSCRIHEYECICYYDNGEEISYDKYVTKDKRSDAQYYCDKLSTNEKNCYLTE
jgi:hypothetical protein